MAKIENLEKVIAWMRNKAASMVKEGNPSVTVGYTANYALFVHENMEAAHPNGGQAKFLEQPFREMKGELNNTIAGAMKAKKTLAQGLVLAGLKLQAASQRLCPVDTGNLRASAFTRLDGVDTSEGESAK